MTEGYKPCDLCGSTIPDEPNELDDLRAEVERLRGEAERERAAVVTWLRDVGCRMNHGSEHEFVLLSVADAAENGEHRRGEGA